MDLALAALSMNAYAPFYVSSISTYNYHCYYEWKKWLL